MEAASAQHLTGLLVLVILAVVAVVTALVVLIRRGRAVPPPDLHARGPHHHV